MSVMICNVCHEEIHTFSDLIECIMCNGKKHLKCFIVHEFRGDKDHFFKELLEGDGYFYCSCSPCISLTVKRFEIERAHVLASKMGTLSKDSPKRPFFIKERAKPPPPLPLAARPHLGKIFRQIITM